MGWPEGAARANAWPERRPDGVPHRTVVAQFRDGKGAARAIDDLTASGLGVQDVYVLRAGETQLLDRLGVGGDSVIPIGTTARVVVAAVVVDGHTAQCATLLGARAQAVDVPHRQ